MSEDTQTREGDCQIASFDSSLPQIIYKGCRRNREDELKGIWQSWDEAKKMHFRDKYGEVAQLLFVNLDDALLKARGCFWDPTHKIFMFNGWIWYQLSRNILPFSTMNTVKVILKDKNGPCISWSNIQDAMGKANCDKHLSLLVFVVYGLIVLQKAPGYVSVELADFLF
ncbi:hypothetical protein Goari_003075 [Gossypium aridum]|uniref:Uncharacterized protein n=1 Tax=Gossypium aridum TaxID=34290 RepID=A0A7J8YC04_GOSAI|nr:hypothetical protein [Gossypium aridum]